MSHVMEMQLCKLYCEVSVSDIPRVAMKKETLDDSLVISASHNWQLYLKKGHAHFFHLCELNFVTVTHK